MSAPQSDGLLCHECVVGRGAHMSSVGGGSVLYYGSIQDIVNTVSHLWWVSLPSSALLSSSASPDPGLGASRFIRGAGTYRVDDSILLLLTGGPSNLKVFLPCSLWSMGLRGRDLLPDIKFFPKIEFVSLRCCAVFLINSIISSIQELKPLFVSVSYIISL